MKGSLANLTSLERRFVVGVGVVVFIVLNLVFVTPRFKDWRLLEIRLKNARDTLTKYETEIAASTNLAAELKVLEGASANVAAEDQPAAFTGTIQTIANQAGVNIQTIQPAPSGTNQFFLEQAQSVVLIAREDNLVNFLHQLGANNSLIRVRDMTLRPDGPRQQLNARLKVVASYQKKPAAKSGPPVPAAGSAASKPANAIKK